MKACKIDRATVTRLEDLPNIGKVMAGDLRLIGIDSPQALIGRDPFELYRLLGKKQGRLSDPCVIDVFMSVVHFMEGGEPRRWWDFTAQRKAMMR